MTATEMKDDLDQESGDQSKVCVKSRSSRMNTRLVNTADMLCDVKRCLMYL